MTNVPAAGNPNSQNMEVSSPEVGADRPSVECRGLSYSYGAGHRAALNNIDLQIGQGQIVILTGPSASGKSTLMQLIGGRLAVHEGYLQVLGRTMNGLGPRQLLDVRRKIGFILQSPWLIASLTAAENVAVALRYQALTSSQRQGRVEEVMDMFGLERRGRFRPHQLSGGDLQRLAIARALAHKPKLILADEPTSLLSHESARRIFELIKSVARDEGCTFLIATHDNRIVDVADTIITMYDGRIAKQETPVVAPYDTNQVAGRSTCGTIRVPKCFICYRREDNSDISARIYDRLVAHFGIENVFIDIDAIPPGADFRKFIDDAVARCDVLLAVVGKRWLEAQHVIGPKQGRRRLDDATDFVRIEIQSALARSIPVIPLLVGGAEMPAEHELPDGLGDFVYRNAAEVRSGRDFDHHMERLIRDIKRLVELTHPLK